MLNPNAKIPELLSVLGVLAPVSQAAGTVNTGWISIQQAHTISFLLQTGVLGASATVDAKIQQATDNSGTGAKDVTGKAITQIVKASGDGKQAWVTVRESELDQLNGFAFVTLSITVGTAASLIGAVALGAALYEPATAVSAATLVQNVG